jgi:hypothetical protein
MLYAVSMADYIGSFDNSKRRIRLKGDHKWWMRNNLESRYRGQHSSADTGKTHEKNRI